MVYFFHCRSEDDDIWELSSLVIYFDLFTLLYFCPMKVYPIFIMKIQPITTVHTFNQSASALSFLFTYEIPHNDIWVNVSNVPQVHRHASPSYVQQVHKKKQQHVSETPS